jgi:hypothetical protein
MPSVLYPPPRPLTIGEVLDSAFAIFKGTLIKCLPYGLLAMVAGQLQSIYDVATGRPLGSHDAGWWWSFGLGTLAMIALWSAVVLRQKAVLDQRPTAIGSDLIAGLRALPSMVAVLLFGLVAGAIGLVLLVIPGLSVLLAIPLAGLAVLLGGQGPTQALGQSWRLISNNALRVFTIFSVGVSMVLVFDMLMFMLVAVLLQFAGTGDLTVVTSYLPVVVIALGAITAPFLCALGLATYGDLQARYATRVAAPAAQGAQSAPAPGERVS